MILIRTILFTLFPNRNGMKDETGNVTLKKCSNFVAFLVSVWREVTLFRAKNELILVRVHNAICWDFLFCFWTKQCVQHCTDQKLSARTEAWKRNILKISPLPRNWKRKNILNAWKRRRKFQNQKGPQSGRDLSVDPGAVPRVKSPPAVG